MTDPKKINEILLTWDSSISIRDLVHSNRQWSLLSKLFCSLPSDIIPGGLVLLFCDELVKNPVERVPPRRLYGYAAGGKHTQQRWRGVQAQQAQQ